MAAKEYCQLQSGGFCGEKLGFNDQTEIWNIASKIYKVPKYLS